MSRHNSGLLPSEQSRRRASEPLPASEKAPAPLRHRGSEVLSTTAQIGADEHALRRALTIGQKSSQHHKSAPNVKDMRSVAQAVIAQAESSPKPSPPEGPKKQATAGGSFRKVVAAVPSIRRSHQKGLFRRQSVAEIFQEARAMERQISDKLQDAAPPVQSGQTSEELLMAAAAMAAAERIGNFKLSRTRSRSLSPLERTPSGGVACIGSDNTEPKTPGSPFKRTESSDDTVLDDPGTLDKIASLDVEWRAKRKEIRRALQQFRPSDDDWLYYCECMRMRIYVIHMYHCVQTHLLVYIVYAMYV
jgi:hypothetical protein